MHILTHLLILLLQLGCLCLIRSTVLGALLAPELTQLLGDIADAKAGVLGFDVRTVV